MTKELLRVSMSADQVREAVEYWCRERTGMSASNTAVAVALIGLPDDITVTVSFTAKRVRKAMAKTKES